MKFENKQIKNKKVSVREQEILHSKHVSSIPTCNEWTCIWVSLNTEYFLLLADKRACTSNISSVGPSKTSNLLRRRANARNVSYTPNVRVCSDEGLTLETSAIHAYTPNLTGDCGRTYTISALVDKTDIQLIRRRRKTVFFLTLVFQGLYKVNYEQSLLFLQKIFERANEKSDRKSKMAPENYLFLLLYIGPVLALPFSSSSH